MLRNGAVKPALTSKHSTTQKIVTQDRRNAACSPFAAAKHTTRVKSRAPAHYNKFRVQKKLRVPVTDNFVDKGDACKLETWIDDPSNIMGVIFSADEIIRNGENEWRVVALQLSFLSWELRPEFTLEATPKEMRLQPEDVHIFGYDLTLNRPGASLPPGFDTMNIQTDIDATIKVSRTKLHTNQTVVMVDLDVHIAAPIPTFIQMVPAFDNICTLTIGTGIDLVAAGAQSRVQVAFNEWASQQVRALPA